MNGSTGVLSSDRQCVLRTAKPDCSPAAAIQIQNLNSNRIETPAKEATWRGFQRIAGLALAGENAHDIQMCGVGGGKSAGHGVGSAGQSCGMVSHARRCRSAGDCEVIVPAGHGSTSSDLGWPTCQLYTCGIHLD